MDCKFTRTAVITLIILFGQFEIKAVDLESSRISEKITVDGKIDEWLKLPSQFFEDEKMSFAISNDNENLYFLFKTREKKVAQQIKVTGVSFYIDIKGKKKKDFYIKFQGGPKFEERTKKKGADDRDRFRCFIKDRILEKDIPLDGSQGPSAAFDTSYGFYAYEFSVPLRKSEVRNYGLGLTDQKKISIGIVWGEFDKSKKRRGAGFGGGGHGSQGGGQMGGGRGGGGGQRGFGPRGDRKKGDFKKQEIWLTIILPEKNIEE